MIPQFANPLLLWGLAAAAVPILIHLLNRRRYRVQRWAAMEWLMQAARQNQRRLRIENLLLLALRTLAVVLLALAVARPTFSEGSLTVDKQAAHLFVLLDSSASMGAKSGAQTSFEQAADTANSLLGEIGSEDPVTLVLTNDNATSDAALNRKTGRPRVVLRGTRDHGKVRRLLGDLKPAAARGDLVESLKVLEDAVPARGSVRSKVAIVTDLQRTSVDGGDGGAAAPDAAVRATLERLREKGAEVVLVPAGRQVNNVAVTSLRAQESRDVVQGATVVFEAEVRNFADRPVNAEVRFLVDGRERGEVSQTIPLGARPEGSDAPPAATAQYTTTFRDGEAGVHVIEARVAADGLAVDDARWFAFEVRRPIRVLAVDGDPSPSDPAATPETFWLVPILALKADGPIRVQRVDTAAYEAELDLDAWDIVVLANVEHPARTQEQRARLEGYLARGGALLLTVGDRVVADVWNRELRGGDAPILPVAVGEPRVDRNVQLRLDLGENRHPLLADITNPAAASFFRSPAIWGWTTLRDVATEKGARVVMTLADFAKTPILVERPFGRGRVLLLATAVDDAWSRLPGDYLYPVLVHETVHYLASRGNAERNILAHQVYTRPLPANFAAFEVSAPDGSPVPVSIDSPADAPQAYATVGDTGQPGGYRATLALRAPDLLTPAPPSVRDAFAVNVPPQESDLRRLGPEDVEGRWPGLVRVATSFAAASESVRPRGGEFHGPLLVAALLCLLGEVLLVRRIARTRGSAA